MPAIENHLATCLYGTSDSEREAALHGLAEFACDDPVAVVRNALRRNWESRPTGRLENASFELPIWQARFPEEQLNFLVPETYAPDTAFGLLVLLHGGGSGTPREAGAKWLGNSQASSSYHFGDQLGRQPYITLAPGNLQLPTHKRWSTPESDEFLIAAIEEAMYRYHIDPDRVAVGGQSMGGFGAYHIAQTIGDRFSTIGCHAGAWSYGYWQGMHGVDFYSMQGIHDAVPGERKRFTESPFARFHHAILSGWHIPHTYREHNGGHSFSDPEARQLFVDFLDHAARAQRNPWPGHIATASRKGAFQLQDCPDWFWLSLATHNYDTLSGTIEMDHIETTEPQPDYATTDFRHRIIDVRGSAVDARYEGDNRFVLRTRNVFKLSLWLHPGMVDLARPIRVVVNGEERECVVPEPNVATAMKSYLRRRDPATICPARISLQLY